MNYPHLSLHYLGSFLIRNSYGQLSHTLDLQKPYNKDQEHRYDVAEVVNVRVLPESTVAALRDDDAVDPHQDSAADDCYSQYVENQNAEVLIPFLVPKEELDVCNCPGQEKHVTGNYD